MKAPIALVKCPGYERVKVEERLFRALEAAGPRIAPGSKILLKPNLLMKRPLACASPQVTAAAAKWLLERGARVTVADSPGFGNPAAIAEAIGLSDELKSLGLKVGNLTGKRRLNLIVDGKKVSFPVSPTVFENDGIFSVCRVKAHSQTRLTLAVKNCFGVIPGLHKAFIHARYGGTTEFFASCVAALFYSLPPVTGVADGIVAMSVTGPSRGEPYSLGLLGVSADAPGLDLAIMKILKARPESVPVARALGRKLENEIFPLERPEDFSSEGFVLPASLKPASFAPWRLLKSCLRRVWASARR